MTPKNLCLLTTAVLLLSAPAMADITPIYEETFYSGGGDYLHRVNTDWTGRWYEDDVDTPELIVYDANSPLGRFDYPDGPKRAPISNHFLYYEEGADWAQNDAFIYYDANADLGQASKLYSLQMDLKNNNHTNEDTRFALRVDGNWFASDAVFNSDGISWTKRELLLAGSQWCPVAFDTDLSLGAAGSLPDGTVSALGIYDENFTTRMRVDNLTVNVPEPGTTALVLMGLGAFLARRRRA